MSTHPEPSAAPPRPGLSSSGVAVVVGAGSLLATVLATIACVGPLVAILLGVGGFGWLSQYAYLRVPASVATGLMLAFGFYWTYRTRTIRGGDLGCGNGLLLIIKEGLAKVAPGELVEIQSRDPTVREDLPAWCRVVGHSLAEVRERGGGVVSYFVQRKADTSDQDEERAAQALRRTGWSAKPTSKKAAIVILWVATVLAVGMNLFEYVIFPRL
jgi:TusA-related sulfurtransferase